MGIPFLVSSLSLPMLINMPSTYHEHSIYISECTCYVSIVSELLSWSGVGIEERGGGYGGEVREGGNLF